MNPRSNMQLSIPVAPDRVAALLDLLGEDSWEISGPPEDGELLVAVWLDRSKLLHLAQSLQKHGFCEEPS